MPSVSIDCTMWLMSPRSIEDWGWTMTHIDLNRQEEAIKRFFLTLKMDPEGSVVELDGQVVAHLLPADARENGSAEDDGPWTDAKNARRCDLIDKDIDGRLTPAEARELQSLQKQMLRHVDRVAPLPLDDARRLHQELLMKAQAALKR